MLVFLFVLLIVIVLYIFSWRFWFKPKPMLSAYKHPDAEIVACDEVGKPPLLDQIVKLISKNKARSSEKYIHGKLGLPAVSRAIKKDYGYILSRKRRKHYSKQYGIPFAVYRGN